MHSEFARKLKIRVWNVELKYIGDFEVSENIPELVIYGSKFYKYEQKWNTFIELKNQPVEVGVFMDNKCETVMKTKMHSEFEGHTPGPWEYCEGDFDGPPIVAKFINERQDKIRISECDFAHIRQAMAILSARGEGGNEFPIEDTQAFSRDTERANAKLIAAAPDLLKENQSLRSELQKLQQWKKEQMQVWGPVLDYMQKHPELSIGESISKRVLEFLKEREKQKELNAELVEGLSKLAQRIRLMMINMEYDPEQDEFFVGIESLIKKSKES